MMKSIYNMIISIINASILPIFLTLSIITQTIKNNTLGIIFISISYSLLLTYFILKAIYYFKEESESKRVLYRISNTFIDSFIMMILIYLILHYKMKLQWILLGGVIGITILEIILDSIEKQNLIKQTISISKFILLIGLGLNHLNRMLLILVITSIIIYGISSILGKKFNNKYLLSLELVFNILFGLFLIFH